MTVPSSTNIAKYLGDGVAVNFPISFPVNQASDILVYTQVIATGVLTAVTPSLVTTTGVTLSVAPAVGTRIYILRQVALSQLVDIVNESGFYPETVEQGLDTLAMQIQQLAEKVNRSLRVQLGDSVSDLPAALSLAGKYVTWDINGNMVIASGTGSDPALRSDLAVAGNGRALIADFATIPQAAPFNFLPNTQWEVWSGVVNGLRWKADGTGPMPTANLISNTTTGPLTTLHMDGVPASWKVGHLIKVNPYAGAGGHAVGDWVMPLISIVNATDITVRLPLNITPGGTGTGTVTNVNIGGSGSVGTGDCADYWKKPVATLAWREEDASDLPPGGMYAMGLQKSTGGSEVIYYPLDIQRFAGRQIVFGAYVKHQQKSGAGTFRLRINSDIGGQAYSTSGTTVGAYEYHEVTALIPANATTADIGLELLGANADVYYFANPMGGFGTYLGPNSYTKPRELLIPIVKVEPAPWVNATLPFPNAGASSLVWAFGVPFDLYAHTQGQLARSIRMVQGNIEAINTNAAVTGTGGSRIIGTVDAAVDPIRLGTFLPQYVQNVKSFGPLRIPLINGQGHIFSAVSADQWSNLSVDLDLIHLQ